MKNSTDSSLTLQALQAQAQQLLPAVTQALSVLQYSEIVHQRLAQQRTKDNCYQGLTRAQHTVFGRVMIKWQLSAHTNHDSSGLSHEIDVLKSLNNLSKSQSSLDSVALLVLDYHYVDIQALGQNQQLTVLVMTYYTNGSLAKPLNGQRHALLTDEQKHHFIKQAAHLIAKLHNAGWLHNDIKPSNILLDGDSIDGDLDRGKMPNLRMTDFALAKKVDDRVASNSTGTPAYLAPERWQGQIATVQSDIYAFGIMMVEILMGERPFKITAQSHDPMIDWATQHCQQPIPKLPSPYSRYQFIIDGALAKRVEKRYQTMEEVILDLEER
ncbi:serine/threonine-protein kinase [Psychrobacter sp. B38]|uniref:serine/threonine protein kinase n=1 Tax=Psychrobacter sp. B38 TaxID=3143538 RepID=UPI003210BB62